MVLPNLMETVRGNSSLQRVTKHKHDFVHIMTTNEEIVYFMGTLNPVKRVN